MGCGIASVAAVLDVDYDQALRLFDRDARNRIGAGHGLPLAKLLDALTKTKVAYRKKRFVASTRSTRLREVPDGAIVLFETYAGDVVRHYLVRDGTGWLDSLDGNTATPNKSKRGSARTDPGDEWEEQTGHRRRELPTRYRPRPTYLAPETTS